jgi:hypothetical protein
MTQAPEEPPPLPFVDAPVFPPEVPLPICEAPPFPAFPVLVLPVLPVEDRPPVSVDLFDDELQARVPPKTKHTSVDLRTSGLIDMPGASVNRTK